MKKCPTCFYAHSKNEPHYITVKKINNKGFPTHEKSYKEDHEKAVKSEKKKYGEKSFKELAMIGSKMKSNELEGKNFKSGKIEVSEKVPKKLRPEVAYHEKVENKLLRKKK